MEIRMLPFDGFYGSGIFKASPNDKLQGFRGLLLLLVFVAISAFVAPLGAYAQQQGDYRSTGNGLWTTSSTWEVFHAGSWTAAATYPGELNSNPAYTVAVLPGHTVFLNDGDSTGYSVDNLEVGGTVYLTGGVSLKGVFVLNFKRIEILTGGSLYFFEMSQLILPQHTILHFNGISSQFLSGSCDNNQEIIFRNCAQPFAVCDLTGLAPYPSFIQLMNDGGTLLVAIDKSGAVSGSIEFCSASPVSVPAIASGLNAASANYSWIIKDSLTQQIVAGPISGTSLNPGLEYLQGLNAGRYIAVLTASLQYQGVCTHVASDSAYLRVLQSPAPPMSGGNQIFCHMGQNQTLTAQAFVPTGHSLFWYDAASGGNPVLIPVLSSPGTVVYYAESVSDQTGCPSNSRTPVTLELVAAPAATINYPDNPFCSNEPNAAVSVVGTPGGVFLSSPTGLAINASTGDLNIASSIPGWYNVAYVMQGTYPCPQTYAYTGVYIEQAPQATVTYATPFCYNSNTATPVINGTLGGFFTYTPFPKLELNTITGAIQFNGASLPGTYTVNYSFPPSFACPASVFSTSVKVLPEITISGVVTNVSCPGYMNGMINLTVSNATPPLNYAWTGPTPVGNTKDAVGLAAGNYSVTVTDANNCSVTYSALVATNPDVTPPVINCGNSVSVQAAPGACTASVVVPGASASDNCMMAAIFGTRSDAKMLNQPYPVGVTTITWTALDFSSNSSVCVQTVTVLDVESPVLACPSDISTPADPGTCFAVLNISAAATDNCGVPVVSGQRSDLQQLTDPFPVGTTSITWTATDASANSTTCVQTIVVFENEDPVIVCPGDITIPTDNGLCSATLALSPALASDNCSDPVLGTLLVTYNRSDALLGNDPFPTGTTLVTWTATDYSGNSAVCQQTIFVYDIEDPVLTCPAPITQVLDEGLCNASIVLLSATASDNCSVAAVTGVRSDVAALNDPFLVGTTTIIWTAVDLAGNSAVCFQDITVLDE
jgi:hypothetical protein